MYAHPPVILVHEPQPYWAPLLQWEFVESQEFAVQATPSLVDFEEKLLQLDVTGCLLLLGESQHQKLLNLVIRNSARRDMFILARDLSLDVEWGFREAGAASVLDSSIPVSQYVRILRKRLQSRTCPQ